MWSDNKKNKEEVDDCRCSGSASDNVGAAAAATVAPVEPSAQQQLNVFSDNNSKKQTAAFGANLTEAKRDDDSDETTSQKQNKQVDNSSAQAIDSGFISGPQSSSNIFDDDDDERTGSNASSSASASSAASSTKLNIPPPSKQNTFASCANVLDSGCIDEPLDEDDEELNAARNAASSGVATIQSAAQQARSNNKQLLLSKSGSSDAANDQMILKQNVDAGMSEWFCNLSLQNNQQQQAPATAPQVAGLGMNNLDDRRTTLRATTSLSSSNNPNPTSFNDQYSNRQQQSQPQQQHAAGNSAFNTNTSSSNSAITHPWEQFYQQNDDGDTHLHLACISGYVDVVAALIRMAPHPCLFNIQNDEAQTPLHLAVLTVQPKILRMLLIAGAEPTIRDRHGNTALHLACIAGEEQCVRALTIPISASEINEAHRLYGHRSNDKTVSYLNYARLPADLEIRNYDGERCVHLAAQAGHIDILRILVLYGADINAREGKSGRTPLHIAIEGCNEDLANFLLDECQKLNLETATYAGLTAYQVACVLNKSQLQNMLERRGAEPLTPPDSDYEEDYDIEDLDETKYDRFGDPGYFTSYGGNPMTVA